MGIPVRRLAEQIAVVGIVAAIAASGLTLWRPVRVSGASMAPVLTAGDLVLVRRGGSVGVRDVVLYQTAGHGPVLHRMIAREGSAAIRTKGDANPIADRDAIPVDAVIGPVRAVVPLGSLIARWRGR